MVKNVAINSSREDLESKGFRFVNVGETNLSSGGHYLWCKEKEIPVKPKRDIEERICFLNLLEFMLSKTKLAAKIMSGSLDDMDLSNPPNLSSYSFGGEELEEFKKELNLTDENVNNLLMDFNQKGFITKIGEGYQFTNKGESIFGLLDLEEYPYLFKYFKTFYYI